MTPSRRPSGRRSRACWRAIVVTERTYVSKADALARFRRTFADLASGMEGLGDNPLPASYEVRLRTGADQAIDSLVGRVRELPGVADVRYDRQWLARLLAAIGIVRRLGLGARHPAGRRRGPDGGERRAAGALRAP